MTSGAYYNDNDPKICAWLRELIKEGLIAPGEVDDRSIKEITADDLKGFTQHHFFAGIGGWSYALRLAGWPDDRPVWTGSCPCPSFSAAGKKKCSKCGSKGLRFFSGPQSVIQEFGCPKCGWRDSRHLWPDFYRLIGEYGPTAVFGEQVASPLAREWLSGVRADLETLGYAVGAADLCAASAGSPQIRQRLWWVSYASGRQKTRNRQSGESAQPQVAAGGHDLSGRLQNTESIRRRGRDNGDSQGEGGTLQAEGSDHAGFWDEFDVLPYRDGEARRVEPGTFPLDHGVPARVLRLCGYGNSINPQTAATFIRAAGRAPVDFC